MVEDLGLIQLDPVASMGNHPMREALPHAMKTEWLIIVRGYHGQDRASIAGQWRTRVKSHDFAEKTLDRFPRCNPEICQQAVLDRRVGSGNLRPVSPNDAVVIGLECLEKRVGLLGRDLGAIADRVQ